MSCIGDFLLLHYNRIFILISSSWHLVSHLEQRSTGLQWQTIILLIFHTARSLSFHCSFKAAPLQYCYVSGNTSLTETLQITINIWIFARHGYSRSSREESDGSITAIKRLCLWHSWCTFTNFVSPSQGCRSTATREQKMLASLPSLPFRRIWGVMAPKFPLDAAAVLQHKQCNDGKTLFIVL